MGMKVTWSDALFGMRLRVLESNLTEEVLEVLDEEIDKIRDAAIDGAPVLHGYLEASIERSDIEKENGEYSIEVGIDPAASNARGYPVEKYGGRLELNQIAPVPTTFSTGTIGLGPKTQAKGGAGGAFIRLAVYGRVGVTASRVKAAIKRALRKSGSR